MTHPSPFHHDPARPSAEGASPAVAEAEAARSLRAASICCAVLAALLLAEVAGGCWYAYAQVRPKLEPAQLADQAEAAIRRRYPEIRRHLVAELNDRAPEWASAVSREALQAAPEVRAQVADWTARQLARGLEEVIDLSVDRFRDFLRNHRSEIEGAFDDLAAAPEQIHESVVDLEQRFEADFAVDVQAQAKSALDLHRALNDKLARLADPAAPLDPTELIERRILRIVKSFERGDASPREASESVVRSSP